MGASRLRNLRRAGPQSENCSQEAASGMLDITTALQRPFVMHVVTKILLFVAGFVLIIQRHLFYKFYSD